MFGSLKAPRTALVPLFKLLDRLVEVKQKLDDTPDMSKALLQSATLMLALILVGVRKISQQCSDLC